MGRIRAFAVGLAMVMAAPVLPSAAVASSPPARAQSGDTTTQLKAIYLYQFTRYVKWPTPSVPLKDGSKPDFVIGVLGDTPVTGVLKLISKRKNVFGRKIVIREFSSRAEMTPCQILLLARNKSAVVPEILKALKGNSTLVVGDGPGMALKGAHINFVVKNKRMKFELNLEALRNTTLRVSSQLKKLAIIVKK